MKIVEAKDKGEAVWLTIKWLSEMKQKKELDFSNSSFGASGWAWTNDPLINSQVL